jgi:hypothetical protein
VDVLLDTMITQLAINNVLCVTTVVKLAGEAILSVLAVILQIIVISA